LIAKAAAFGWRWRVKRPLRFKPPIRIVVWSVAKSNIFQGNSPIRNSIEIFLIVSSKHKRWIIMKVRYCVCSVFAHYDRFSWIEFSSVPKVIYNIHCHCNQLSIICLLQTFAHLHLPNNAIKHEGGRYLAQALQHNQVTSNIHI